jgi:hypothetical protein
MSEQQTSLYVALGISQGIIADASARTLAGTVRRGGELVSITQNEYDLWSSLLTPRSHATLDEIASLRGWVDIAEQVRQLVELGLVAELDLAGGSNGDLAHLRPVPRGVGLGNLSGDGGVYQIQDLQGSGSTPLSVDAVMIMLWWEFDGAASLATAAASVATRCPDVPHDMIESIAVSLVVRLMTQRLLHLDTTYEAASR